MFVGFHLGQTCDRLVPLPVLPGRSFPPCGRTAVFIDLYIYIKRESLPHLTTKKREGRMPFAIIPMCNIYHCDLFQEVCHNGCS